MDKTNILVKIFFKIIKFFRMLGLKNTISLLFVLSVFYGMFFYNTQKVESSSQIRNPQKTDQQKEENFINALKESSLQQRKGAYAKLAHSICFIHKKPGSAYYYEQCMNKYYAEYLARYEAEVRLANPQ